MTTLSKEYLTKQRDKRYLVKGNRITTIGQIAFKEDFVETKAESILHLKKIPDDVRAKMRDMLVTGWTDEDGGLAWELACTLIEAYYLSFKLSYIGRSKFVLYLPHLAGDLDRKLVLSEIQAQGVMLDRTFEVSADRTGKFWASAPVSRERMACKDGRSRMVPKVSPQFVHLRDYLVKRLQDPELVYKRQEAVRIFDEYHTITVPLRSF